MGWGGDVLRERMLGTHAMDKLRMLSIIEVMGRHYTETRLNDGEKEGCAKVPPLSSTLDTNAYPASNLDPLCRF